MDGSLGMVLKVEGCVFDLISLSLLIVRNSNLEFVSLD